MDEEKENENDGTHTHFSTVYDVLTVYFKVAILLLFSNLSMYTRHPYLLSSHCTSSLSEEKKNTNTRSKNLGMTLHFLLIVECQESNSYLSTCSQEETHTMKLGSALMCEVGIRSIAFKGKRVGRGKRQVLGDELLKTAKTMGH